MRKSSIDSNSQHTIDLKAQKTSSKMLIKKFLRDFDDLSDEVGVGGNPESNISFSQYRLILKKMGFIGTESKEEQKKIDQIWLIIRDESNS